MEETPTYSEDNLNNISDENSTSLETLHQHYTEGTLSDAELDFIADKAISIVQYVLECFSEYDVTIDEYDGDDGELILDINNGDLAVLIGRHGKALDALQMVVSSVLSAQLKFHYPIVVDIEGYKNRRKKKLQSIALAAAERCKTTQNRVVLAPMSAYERRIIHISLVDDEAITTFSEGEEPNRRIVIVPNTSSQE